MSAEHAQQFSYHRTGIKIYIAILLIIWVLACIILPFWRREGWVEAEFFLGVSFVLLLVLFTNACFLESDIEVDENTISWKIFGWQWKTILWENINHVRVYSVWDYEQRRKTKMYYFYETKKRRPYFFPKGGMGFRETVSDAEELERIVLFEIERRKLRLLEYARALDLSIKTT